MAGIEVKSTSFLSRDAMLVRYMLLSYSVYVVDPYKFLGLRLSAPIISLEWLKLESSNGVTRRLKT